MKGICRVCELVDKDKTIKLVYFCDKCNAFICPECEPNLLRRGVAMILDKVKTKW